MNFDVEDLPSPCFVVDEERLTRNLEILDSVQQRTGFGRLPRRMKR